MIGWLKLDVSGIPSSQRDVTPTKISLSVERSTSFIGTDNRSAINFACSVSLVAIWPYLKVIAYRSYPCFFAQ